jgi:hypothetical protein
LGCNKFDVGQSLNLRRNEIVMESSLLLLRELLSLYLLFVSLHGHVHGNTRIPKVKQEIRCGAFQLSTGELIEIFSCLVKR